MSLRKQRVRLKVLIDETWRTSDRLQVYTDWGTGTVDTDRPLLRRAVPIFPTDIRQTVHHGGYGDDPYGAVPYGGGRAVFKGLQYYGAAGYGDIPYGDGVRYMTVEVLVPQAYGSWKFGAQAVDGAGNAQGALVELSVFVAGTDPEPVSSFAYSSYNEVSDVVTFAITA